MRILKDGGCNANVVSKDFLDRHKDIFHVNDTCTLTSHSKNSTIKVARQVVLDAEWILGEHCYRSNFVVADFQYDILIGMPWNKDNLSDIDYDTSSMVFENMKFPVTMGREVTVSSLYVKKFRSLIRKRKRKGDDMNFQVFGIVESPSNRGEGHNNAEDPELRNLLPRIYNVLKDELPEGLTPERYIDHAIKVKEGVIPRLRPLYLLSRG